MTLAARFSAAFKAFKFSGQTPWLTSLFWPGTQIDYRTEAGELTDNSAVSACLGWLTDVWPEAPLTVYQTDSDGGKNAIPDHPLTQLLQDPNPWYGEDLLWAGFILSLNLDGNAYWHVLKNGAGEPVQLFYIPHQQICPKWSADGTDYISHYEYNPNGQIIKLAPEEVIHFRQGLDPQNTRKGLSRVKSVLREVFTDNEAANYASALLKNMGIPGVLISPKSVDPNQRVVISREAAEQMKDDWGRKTTGDRRGEPLIQTLPVDVQMLSFNPDQMNLRDLRRLPEERICAAFRIPPGVVKLGAGLERNTYNNSQTEQEQAYRNAVLPTQRTAARQIKKQLLAAFTDDPSITVGFDTSEVAALTEDMNEKAKRVVLLFAGNVIKRSEARENMGMPSDPAVDDFYAQELGAQIAADLAAQQPPDGGPPVEQRSMAWLMDHVGNGNGKKVPV